MLKVPKRSCLSLLRTQQHAENKFSFNSAILFATHVALGSSFVAGLVALVCTDDSHLQSQIPADLSRKSVREYRRYHYGGTHEPRAYDQFAHVAMMKPLIPIKTLPDPEAECCLLESNR